VITSGSSGYRLANSPVAKQLCAKGSSAVASNSRTHYVLRSAPELRLRKFQTPRLVLDLSFISIVPANPQPLDLRPHKKELYWRRNQIQRLFTCAFR